MSWKTAQIVSFIFVAFAFIFLIWEHSHTRQNMALNSETYVTIIHKAIRGSIEASKIPDPLFALGKVIEAKAIVETLSKTCGGDVILGEIAKVNIANVLNLINQQEKDIRTVIPQWIEQQCKLPFVELHPLAFEVQ